MKLVSAGFPAAPTPRSAAALEFLPAALEVIDTPASPAARATALTIGGFFVVALAWSIIGKVDIIATAPGTVIPVGKSKVVQPLEAGIVKSILVADGDHVRAGQALIELDLTQAGAERDRIAGDLRQARLDVAGLTALRRAMAAGGDLVSFVAPAGTPAGEAEVENANILARAQEQAQKIASLMQQIAGKVAEASENTAAMSRLRASLPYVQQKRDMYRTLMRSQLAPVPAWADAEQAFIEQQQQILVLGEHAGTIAAERAGLLRDLAQARATYARDLLKDLGDAQQKVDELSAEYAAASRKAEDTVLRAPIDGTVQQLAAHTVGGVVTPAQQLMTIVPDAPAVLIEANVENKDVGFVHAGQDVEVKVETFTFTRYGLMHGHVIDISRDTAAVDPRGAATDGTNVRPDDERDRDDDGKPTGAGYVAHVALDSNKLAIDGQPQRLEPGMSVTAEIKTGRRSVISYLVSPLARYKHDGMTER
jgi:hemolysin D